MKRISMAILLFVSIGCLFPTEVRAEAPTPRGGCWSREIVMRPIADPQMLTTIQGRVIAIEHNQKNQPLAAKEIVTWVRVKTTSGEEKSVYLGLARSLTQQRLQLKVRDVVEIQGVQMPKAKQATIVANTVKKGDRVWKIDNLADKPTGVKSCRYNG